jgi:hypothetical protein
MATHFDTVPRYYAPEVCPRLSCGYRVAGIKDGAGGYLSAFIATGPRLGGFRCIMGGVALAA